MSDGMQMDLFGGDPLLNSTGQRLEGSTSSRTCPWLFDSVSLLPHSSHLVKDLRVQHPVAPVLGYSTL